MRFGENRECGGVAVPEQSLEGVQRARRHQAQAPPTLRMRLHGRLRAGVKHEVDYSLVGTS